MALRVRAAIFWLLVDPQGHAARWLAHLSSSGELEAFALRTLRSEWYFWRKLCTYRQTNKTKQKL